VVVLHKKERQLPNGGLLTASIGNPTSKTERLHQPLAGANFRVGFQIFKGSDKIFQHLIAISLACNSRPSFVMPGITTKGVNASGANEINPARPGPTPNSLRYAEFNPRFSCNHNYPSMFALHLHVLKANPLIEPPPLGECNG